MGDSSSAAVRGLAQNRRRGRRHRLNVPALLVAEADSVRQVSVEITELSVGGVGIRSAEALEVGAIFSVRAFDTLLPPGTRVRIVSSRGTGGAGAFGTGFEVGAEVVGD
jgi:hypothetical protein